MKKIFILFLTFFTHIVGMDRDEQAVRSSDVYENLRKFSSVVRNIATNPSGTESEDIFFLKLEIDDLTKEYLLLLTDIEISNPEEITELIKTKIDSMCLDFNKLVCLFKAADKLDMPIHTNILLIIILTQFNEAQHAPLKQLKSLFSFAPNTNIKEDLCQIFLEDLNSRKFLPLIWKLLSSKLLFKKTTDIDEVSALMKQCPHNYNRNFCSTLSNMSIRYKPEDYSEGHMVVRDNSNENEVVLTKGRQSCSFLLKGKKILIQLTSPRRIIIVDTKTANQLFSARGSAIIDKRRKKIFMINEQTNELQIVDARNFSISSTNFIYNATSADGLLLFVSGKTDFRRKDFYIINLDTHKVTKSSNAALGVDRMDFNSDNSILVTASSNIKINFNFGTTIYIWNIKNGVFSYLTDFDIDGSIRDIYFRGDELVVINDKEVAYIYSMSYPNVANLMQQIMNS